MQQGVIENSWSKGSRGDILYFLWSSRLTGIMAIGLIGKGNVYAVISVGFLIG